MQLIVYSKSGSYTKLQVGICKCNAQSNYKTELKYSNWFFGQLVRYNNCIINYIVCIYYQLNKLTLN